jgi:ABC-type antimicrobial peptide transport system permease subunit
MIGIYGILANLVAARTREIGIRMAIGAAPSEIARLILRQSMFPVLIGLVVGFSASLILGRFLEALLYNVRPRDPLTLAGAILAILLIAPAAVYIPMRRATRVECTVALRDE